MSKRTTKPRLDQRAQIIPEAPVFAGEMKRRHDAFENADGPDPLSPQCKKSVSCYLADGHKGGCRRE